MAEYAFIIEPQMIYSSYKCASVILQSSEKFRAAHISNELFIKKIIQPGESRNCDKDQAGVCSQWAI